METTGVTEGRVELQRSKPEAPETCSLLSQADVARRLAVRPRPVPPTHHLLAEQVRGQLNQQGQPIICWHGFWVVLQQLLVCLPR